MYRDKLLTVLLMTGLLSVCSNMAQALPADQSLEYRIYDGEEVVFTVQLELKAVDVDGDEIAWFIQRAGFAESDPETGSWEQLDPYVDTADGYWWVEHADTDEPEIAEFSIPPLLLGRAGSLNQGDDDLDFSFEGKVYTEPPGGRPFDITVALDFVFQRLGEPEPEEEGEDEPAELDEPPGSE